jgi:hypothetical protein
MGNINAPSLIHDTLGPVAGVSAAAHRPNEAPEDLVNGSSSLPLRVAGGGFVPAFIFAAVADRANFCTVGAVSDIIPLGHRGRLRLWLPAAAGALIGANLLYYFGRAALSKSVP